MIEGLQEAALQARIRVRAYEIYEVRGNRDGHALDDWLEAEREIVHSIRMSVAALSYSEG